VIKSAGGIVVFLLEELADARMRCAQLKRLVAEAIELVEKSSHKDHFFEVAAHLIHDIPDNLLRMEKALDAAAMSGARMDYEEIKGNLKPEKAEQMEQVLDDTRLKLLRRRSGETMSAKTAAEVIRRIATLADETGEVPVGDLLVLVASLERGVKQASEVSASDRLRKLADGLLEAKNPSRVALAKELRSVLADMAQPTASQVAAALMQQASSREDVMKGFKDANPALTDDQLEEIADHWEENKDVVKEKHASMSNATVASFLQVLVSKLTQYDMREEKKHPNIYRLGLLLKAKENVEKAVASVMDRDDAEALGLLKKALQRFFAPDFSPARNVAKQIDAWLASQKLPSILKSATSLTDAQINDKSAATVPDGRMKGVLDTIEKNVKDIRHHLTKAEESRPNDDIALLFNEIRSACSTMVRRLDDKTAFMGAEAGAAKQSRFEEGKSADPTENMSEEDAKKWKVEHDKHKDSFKAASDDWTRTRGGDWKLKTPEGEFWIGDASGSRSGKFEVEYTTADGKTRYDLGRTRSEEAAKKLVAKKLRELRGDKTAAAKLDKNKAKKWMRANLKDYIDHDTDEANTTKLAEECCQALDCYDGDDIPEELFELSQEVAEAHGHGVRIAQAAE